MNTNIVRIMIVDERGAAQFDLSNLLTGQPGWEVVAEAGTVTGAIQLAAKHEPEVILMDIHLPDGSGLDACREIVKAHPQVKIIILTSCAEDELLFRAISAGAVGYVLKQVGPDDLLRVIDMAVRGKASLGSKTAGPIRAQNRRDHSP